jgi:hypothetical protein
VSPQSTRCACGRRACSARAAWIVSTILASGASPAWFPQACSHAGCPRHTSRSSVPDNRSRPCLASDDSAPPDHRGHGSTAAAVAHPRRAASMGGVRAIISCPSARHAPRPLLPERRCLPAAAAVQPLGHRPCLNGCPRPPTGGGRPRISLHAHAAWAGAGVVRGASATAEGAAAATSSYLRTGPAQPGATAPCRVRCARRRGQSRRRPGGAWETARQADARACVEARPGR